MAARTEHHGWVRGTLVTDSTVAKQGIDSSHKCAPSVIPRRSPRHDFVCLTQDEPNSNHSSWLQWHFRSVCCNPQVGAGSFAAALGLKNDAAVEIPVAVDENFARVCDLRRMDTNKGEHGKGE